MKCKTELRWSIDDSRMPLSYENVAFIFWGGGHETEMH